MKDWKAYIIAQLDSDVWGGIALDYYSTQKVKESEPMSSEDFVDWITKEISPECKDVIEFHRIFLGVAVRLFGSDFDKAMQCSIRLLRKHKETPDLDVCTSFVKHYNDYKVADRFKDLLKKSFDMTSSENGCEGKEQPVRLCHISDLHFGFFHDSIKYIGIDHEYQKTDHFINFLREEDLNGRKIDLLIISGDITSVAADEEYVQFIKFIEEVKGTKVMPEDDYYERIVLVPGNHEARRGEDYERADYLNNFKEFIESQRDEGLHFSTPYSIENEDLCVIKNASKEKIPYAMHEYPLLQIQVLTLVSSHYAQAIDKEISTLMAGYEELKSEFNSSGLAGDVFGKLEAYFKKRIWLDKGVFSLDYFGLLRTSLQTYLKEPEGSAFLRIAVAHHNPTNYFGINGIEHTQNAPELLEVLGELGFSYYLHGHIHYNPKPQESNNVMQLSASTLGGTPLKGFAGFNILEWTPGSKSKCSCDRYELRGNMYEKLSK